MKSAVGILTFVKVGNYGAELQAFALSKVLQLKGIGAETIDCSIKDINIEGYENRFVKQSTLSIIKSLIISALNFATSMLYYKRKRSRKKAFEQFYSDYMSFSDNKIRSFNDLYSSSFHYDVVIVGSDQVWNYSYPFKPDPFLLTFVDENTRKISYAASIGKSYLPENLAEVYRTSLSRFFAVSVREKSAVDILKKIGIDSIQVLDPTLLLDKDNWKKLLQIDDRVPTPRYILVYELLKSDILIPIAQNIAKKYSYKIVYLASQIFPYHYGKNIEYVYDAGPRKFVELFMNASFVLTTSFHGTAFAVNFNIPFYSIINKNRGGNARIIDLLHDLCLSNRVIEESQDTSLVDFTEHVTFDMSMSLLNKMRDHSLKFLDNSLR